MARDGGRTGSPAVPGLPGGAAGGPSHRCGLRLLPDRAGGRAVARTGRAATGALGEPPAQRLRRTGEERAGDGEDEHIGGGQRAELRVGAARGGRETGDDDVELAPGGERGAGAQPALDRDTGARGGGPPGGRLGEHAEGGEQGRGAEDRGKLGRVGVEAEGAEE